jgi:hypothetical protein
VWLCCRITSTSKTCVRSKHFSSVLQFMW